MCWFGPGQLIVVCLIVLLLFGQQLPELMNYSRTWRRLRRHEQDSAEKLVQELEPLGKVILIVVALLVVVSIAIYLYR